ncbi:aspartate carbamoyltransferase [Nostoc sp. FACHB-973]|nr:aspartate carbamoyltransferase [Nostoc sp. FACHB-973]
MQPVENSPSSAQRRRYFILLMGIIILATLGGGYLIGKYTTQSQTIEQRQSEVAARGAKVMPFDLTLTSHKFTPTTEGGIQTVTANDSGDTTQIELIRDHLQQEAKKFAAGDFSDPATIHGDQMPGLAKLRSGANRIKIQYESLPNGARLRYLTTDSSLVVAVHEWFKAQHSDHGNHGSM